MCHLGRPRNSKFTCVSLRPAALILCIARPLARCHSRTTSATSLPEPETRAPCRARPFHASIWGARSMHAPIPPQRGRPLRMHRAAHWAPGHTCIPAHRRAAAAAATPACPWGSMAVPPLRDKFMDKRKKQGSKEREGPHQVARQPPRRPRRLRNASNQRGWSWRAGRGKKNKTTKNQVPCRGSPLAWHACPPAPPPGGTPHTRRHPPTQLHLPPLPPAVPLPHTTRRPPTLPPHGRPWRRSRHDRHAHFLCRHVWDCPGGVGNLLAE